MKAKFHHDMKEALKAKQKIRLETVRGMLAAMQYEQIQKGIDELPEADCVAMLQREIKKRRESMEFAEKAGRQEMIDRLKEEIGIIEGYLPQQISPEKLSEMISAMKKENPTINMGGVMKALKEKYAGQYDSKLASDLAKKLLG